VDDLDPLGIPALQAHFIEEIANGSTLIATLRSIAIEEVLGRFAVRPEPQLLAPRHRRPGGVGEWSPWFYRLLAAPQHPDASAPPFSSAGAQRTVPLGHRPAIVSPPPFGSGAGGCAR
jgi:hypothetical protein